MFAEWILLILIGLSFGSFLNVLIVRIPQDESIIRPRSFCRSCDTVLKWYHNIPVLSYFVLRGQCAYCDAKISFKYPAIEILTAFIFIIVFLKEGFGIPALMISIVFSLLLALSMIDIAIKMAPDSLNLAALTLAILHQPDVEHLYNALILAGGFSLLRFYVSYMLQKEALGEGDIMIAGTMGALLGLQLSLAAVFLASLIALPIAYYFKYKNEAPEIPFIPFLALGTLSAYLLEGHIQFFLESLHG